MPRAKPTDKPRGRMSAYSCFMQICREEHKAIHPEENIVFSEFSKMCGNRWKMMKDYEKQPFYEMAERDKLRYDAEMSAYGGPKESDSPKKTPKKKCRKHKDPNSDAPKIPECEDWRKTVMEPSMNTKVCYICDKKFSTISNKKRHQKARHGLSFPTISTTKVTSVICKECQISFCYLRNLREHLHLAHGIVSNKVDHEFASKEDFLDWKRKLEEEIGVHYTLHRSHKHDKIINLIYYCNRSGIKRGPDPAECQRIKSSRKIGCFCTSSIEARQTETDENIKVTFFIDHYGHKMDILPNLAPINLPKCDRDKVADMIVSGMSFNQILDQVRASSGGSRASLLGQNDIEYIATELGLKKFRPLDMDDSLSVLLIIEKMKKNQEILYFKDQGMEDSENPSIEINESVLGFMKKSQEQYLKVRLEKHNPLKVSIDSSYGSSHYSGYQLTTLLIVDDLNHGIPVAFLISSSVNDDIIQTFFMRLKYRIGPIYAAIFMSDDNEVFRNAWKACMDETETCVYLNFSWHTDRIWRSSIDDKIKGATSSKTVVYQMLLTLMDEPQEEAFHQKCQEFLNHLLEAGFMEFHEYFKSNYLSEDRITLWPNCYRGNTMLYSNNHLESMHELLKYVYLSGKKLKRLDHTIMALEKIVKDKLSKRMINLLKHRTVNKSLYCISEGQNEEKEVEVVIQEDQDMPLEHSFSMIENDVKEDNSLAVDFKQNCEPTKPRDASKELIVPHEVVIDEKSGRQLTLKEGIEQVIATSLSEFVPKCRYINDVQVLKHVQIGLRQLITSLDAGAEPPEKKSRFIVRVNTSKKESNENSRQREGFGFTHKRKRSDKIIGLRTIRITTGKKRVKCETLPLQSDSSIPVVSSGAIPFEHGYA